MEKTPQEIQEKLKRVVDKITALPTIPQMFDTLNKLLMNPRTSAKEVAQAIASDPSVAAKVLKIVNSPFYGFPNRITTITHAIVILGFNTVKSIVLGSTIFDIFKKGEQNGFDQIGFWKHSIGCAAACKAIGKMVGIQQLEELFLSGLLHDMGKIVLQQYLRESHDQIQEIVKREKCLGYKAEEKVLGFTHAEIGAWLFEKWNMAKGLVETTRFHHNPALASTNQRGTAIVHFSDICIRALRFGRPGDEKIPIISDTAWKLLGIPETSIERILNETMEEIERSTIFLDFIKNE